MANERDDVMGKVALGATGVALAAGGLAAAALLANKKNRIGMTRVASKTFKKLGKVRDAFQNGASESYQAVAHRIGTSKTNFQKGRKSTAKSSRRRSNQVILHRIDMDKEQKDNMSSTGRGRKQKRSRK